MSAFQSVFAERLASFVKLRRQLGLRFVQQEKALLQFDRYVHQRDYRGALTEELARAFAMDVSNASSTIPAQRYLLVRQFTEYLATFDPCTPRLDPKAIRRVRLRPPPYIFSEQELERLLLEATELSRKHLVLNQALHAMIGLAASTGLRLREVLGLDLSDVDLETGVLVIRRSKFDKDRLVPVHATTLDVLRAYAAVREQMPLAVGETAFFLNARGRRFTRPNLEYRFRQFVRRIGLRSLRGKPPTFYSLRHTFAVRRLIAWYQDGQNVQSLLPALATYMGHVHYTSTAYYLTATAELLDVAASRLDGANRVETLTQEAPHAQEK